MKRPLSWLPISPGTIEDLGKRPKNKGATLVEVILVVAILGFGITATSILFSANLRAGVGNREQSACAALVTDVMERLRALPSKATTGKSIEALKAYLDSKNNGLSAFYDYVEASAEERNAFTAVIPNVFNLSTLRLSEGSQEYKVELEVQWKSSMQPVRVVTAIVEGGINDLLQQE